MHNYENREGYISWRVFFEETAKIAAGGGGGPQESLKVSPSQFGILLRNKSWAVCGKQ
jgi:hypothetical protein